MTGEWGGGVKMATLAKFCKNFVLGCIKTKYAFDSIFQALHDLHTNVTNLELRKFASLLKKLCKIRNFFSIDTYPSHPIPTLQPPSPLIISTAAAVPARSTCASSSARSGPRRWPRRSPSTPGTSPGARAGLQCAQGRHLCFF